MIEQKVVILLATYNGEMYIREQLDSIINQTYRDFVIYISDDGSTDDTIPIIMKYRNDYPDKIVILEHKDSYKSAKGNFINLLRAVESDLYFFCDQDDIWTANHIEVFLNKYKTLSGVEKQEPILIHSDLTVVDNNLCVLANSFLQYLKLPRNPRKRYYFLMNNVTGCVSMINDSLKKKAFYDYDYLQKNIDKITMHDHFFSLVAVEFGKKIFIDDKTNLYRQHDKNVLGAGGGYNFKGNIRKFFQINKTIQGLETNKRFVKFFADYFQKELSLSEYKIMKEFCDIKSKNKISRIYFLIKNGILKYDIYRNIILFFVI